MAYNHSTRRSAYLFLVSYTVIPNDNKVIPDAVPNLNDNGPVLLEVCVDEKLLVVVDNFNIFSSREKSSL